MFTGSTAAGEPMLPHFQFLMMEHSDDTQCVNIRISALKVNLEQIMKMIGQSL